MGESLSALRRVLFRKMGGGGPIACRHLDIHSRECRVYHKRFEVGEGCMLLTPEVVASVRWLPDECGYVQHARKSAPGPKVSGPRSKTRKRK